MKVYTDVSRKTVGEDHIAICPQFGCEFITRVKPLKFGFLGFGKHPKCKKHHIPLVFIDERIGDFIDATLACFFDKKGLPPNELLASIKSKFSEELELFVQGWVYCITVGRGTPIVSRYMDTISNAYLKQLTKKQIKALKKENKSKISVVNQAIKNGLNEIINQYTRLLKHLRVHSEIFFEQDNLKPLSKILRNYLNEWQKNILKQNEVMKLSEIKREMTLKEIKHSYDQILNVGTCRCLLGLNPESKELKKAKITAFNRFSAYHDFYNEDLTEKFTKSDVLNLLKTNNKCQKRVEKKTQKSILSNSNKQIGELFNTDVEKDDKENMNFLSRSVDFLNNDEKKNLEINKHASSDEEQKDLETNQSRISLQKYIEPIIQKYLFKVENFRKKQLRLGLGYIPKNSPSLMKAYISRGKSDWIGIIYKITEILIENNKKINGRILYGYTTDTLERRWERYKTHANNDFMENQKIHNAILKIQNRGKNPDDFFIREVIEVHFDYILMRKRERFWIAKDKTQDPKIGFNTNKGGEGGSQIRISMKALIKYLALGYGASHIARIISYHQEYTISKNTIRRRINEYWGNYKKAKMMFLKPVLEGLIIDGFRSKDIISAFGKRGRSIVETKIPLYFNGMTFLEVRRNYLLNQLTKIIPYVSIEEKVFSELENFGRVEIINLINKIWGGFYRAQKKLRQSIVIEHLRANWGGPAIFSTLGYSDSYSYNHHNDLMQKLFGLNTELARCFFTIFYTKPPNEFTQTIKLEPRKVIYIRAKSLLENNRDSVYSGSNFIRDLGGLGYTLKTVKKQSGRIIKKYFGMNFVELKDYIYKDILPPDLDRRRSFFDEYFNGNLC